MTQLTDQAHFGSVSQDELSEGVGSLVAVNDRIQAFVGELEETCRSIEVWSQQLILKSLASVIKKKHP